MTTLTRITWLEDPGRVATGNHLGAAEGRPLPRFIASCPCLAVAWMSSRRALQSLALMPSWPPALDKYCPFTKPLELEVQMYRNNRHARSHVHHDCLWCRIIHKCEDVAYNICFKMGATWLTSFLFVFFQMMTLEFTWEWVSVWSYHQLFLLFWCLKYQLEKGITFITFFS